MKNKLLFGLSTICFCVFMTLPAFGQVVATPATIDGVTPQLDPDPGAAYFAVPGLGELVTPAFFIGAAGAVDGTMDFAPSVIGSSIIDGTDITTTESNTINADGSCTLQIVLDAANDDLNPGGLVGGGNPLDVAAIFMGASAGGTPVAWTVSGPPVTVSGILTTLDAAGAPLFGPFDVTGNIGGAGGNWDGSLGIQIGAGTAGAGIATWTFDYTYFDGTCVELPVELSSFEAVASNGAMNLAWTTQSETNNAGFDVQQFVDGDFVSIGFVDGAGSTVEQQNYSYTVSDLAPGEYKFRLKQTDFDGAYTYSDILTTLVTVPEGYAISSAYPNPFNPTTSLQIGVEVEQNVSVDVYNMTGQKIATVFNGVVSANEMQTVNVALNGVPSGQYILAVQGLGWVDHQVVTMLK